MIPFEVHDKITDDIHPYCKIRILELDIRGNTVGVNT